MKRIFAFILLCLIFGCTNKKINEREVGVLIDIKVIPTSFNEIDKTRVETTKGIFIVNYFISGIKGNRTYIQEHENGERYLFIDRTPKGKRLL